MRKNTAVAIGILLGMVSTAHPEDRSTKSDAKTTIYSPLGKRDPFRAPTGGAQERDLASLQPTERFHIDKYELKAILRGMGNPRAMFEDPEGKTFILSEGDMLGRERGTISRILNREVIVTERTFNYLGVESLFERVLTLPQEEYGAQIERGKNQSTEVSSSARRELERLLMNAAAASQADPPPAPAPQSIKAVSNPSVAPQSSGAAGNLSGGSNVK